jgi:glycosyl transferase family 25
MSSGWRDQAVARGETLVKAYVINLDRSADRLAHMNVELGRVGVAFERVAAVDGAALRPDELRAFRAARSEANPGGWLPGEIGCFLSHLEAWRRIATGVEAWATIFEDDVRVAADLRALLASADWIPAEADVVRLEANRPMRLADGRPIEAAPGRKVFRALSGTAGAAGYLIAKDACRWLIETPARLHTSADNFLFKPKVSAVARRLRRYQVVPAVCVQEGVAEGEPRTPSLIKPRNTRGRGYRERTNPLLAFWPMRRVAVPFKP